MIKQVTIFAFLLSFAFLSLGCQKDVGEVPVDPNKPTPENTGETFSLSIDVDTELEEEVSNSSKAAVSLKPNPTDQVLPIIDLDRLEYLGVDPSTGRVAKMVNVNVVIKSNDPSQPATYLRDVRFVRKGDKILCLANRNLTLTPGTTFNNDGGRKWYIMAIIGGDLKTTQTDDCVGTNGGTTYLDWGPASSDPATRRPNYTPWINVPMAVMPWAEIRLPPTAAGVSATSGNANAEGGTKPNKFKMMGSILRVVVKNNLQLSQGQLKDFSGIILKSNIFSTNGYFVFNTPTEGGFPYWKDRTRVGQAGTYKDNIYNPLSASYEKFATIPLPTTTMPALNKGESTEILVWVAPRVGERGWRLQNDDTKDVQPAKPATLVSIGTMQMGTNPHLYFTTTAREIKPATYPLPESLKEGTAYKVGGYEVRPAIPQVGKVHTITIDIVRPVLPLEFVADYNIGTTPKTFALDHTPTNQGFYSGINRSSEVTHYGAIGAVGDVAPSGYHVPTFDELNGIFTSAKVTGPTTFSSKINYSTTTSDPVGEVVQGDGFEGYYLQPVMVATKQHSLPAYYKNMGGTSSRYTYALRYGGKENNPDYTLLKTAWSYSFHNTLVVNGKSYNNVLVVKSRWVGDPDLTTPYTVSTIANSNFFDAQSPAAPPRVYGPVVTRYFVATGKLSETLVPESPEYVKLAGQPWGPPEGIDYTTDRPNSPRVLFNNEQGGTVFNGYNKEFVPIRPFINPATLGYYTTQP